MNDMEQTIQEVPSSIYVKEAEQPITSNAVDPEHKQDYGVNRPEDIGRIADIDNARELANTEKTEGQDARIALENKMETQAREGLTEEQKFNIQMMEGIAEKYPKNTELVTVYGDKKLVTGIAYHENYYPENDPEKRTYGTYLILDDDGAYNVKMRKQPGNDSSHETNIQLATLVELYKRADKLNPFLDGSVNVDSLLSLFRHQEKFSDIFSEMKNYIDMLGQVSSIDIKNNFDKVKDTLSRASEILPAEIKPVTANDFLSRL